MCSRGDLDSALKRMKEKADNEQEPLWSPSVTGYFLSLNLTCFSFPVCANREILLFELSTSLSFIQYYHLIFLREPLSSTLRLCGLDETELTASSRGQTHDLDLVNCSHRDQFRNGSTSQKRRGWFQGFSWNQWVSDLLFLLRSFSWQHLGLEL